LLIFARFHKVLLQILPIVVEETGVYGCAKGLVCGERI